MPNYNVYLGDEIIGSVNLSNCNCSKFMYLGTDPSGNTMLYKPSLHTIKECLLDSTPLPRVCSYELSSNSQHCKDYIGIGTRENVDIWCRQFYYDNYREGHETENFCVVGDRIYSQDDERYSCKDSSNYCNHVDTCLGSGQCMRNSMGQFTLKECKKKM